jgi:membrane protein YqaA with SNARE-associated domain
VLFLCALCVLCGDLFILRVGRAKNTVRILARLKEYLLLFGIPGLFVISLLDSAAVPMAGGPDGVLLLLSWQKPTQIPWLVLAAATGSTLGCLILYRIGRAGGKLARISHQLSTAAADPGMSAALRSVGRLDVLSSTPAAPSGRAPCIHARLRRLATKSDEKSGLALARVSPGKWETVRRQVESNGFLAVFLGVIAPPPFPTKPIILAAGVFRIPLVSFIAAVFSGRLIRYAVVAYLGYRFGDQAAQVIKSHYLAILLFMAGLAILILLLRRLLRK